MTKPEFEYDAIMKRYEVEVPQVIAGETSQLVVAYISEDNRLTLLRELRIDLVRNILMHWDEHEYQTRELQDMLDDGIDPAVHRHPLGTGFSQKDNKKGDK